MRIAVILSTYNSPERLEKVLCGYSIQKHGGFELIVADDGSSAETRTLIERMGHRLGMDIRHVWHEDRGFRKCAIMNKAAAATTADYLIFSDGDCVPRTDFVSTHVCLAEPGHYLSGGCFRLTLQATRSLTCEAVLAGRAVDLGFLNGNLSPTRLKKYRLLIGPGFGRALDVLTTTRPTWNGHNSSCWRSDLVAAKTWSRPTALTNACATAARTGSSASASSTRVFAPSRSGTVRSAFICGTSGTTSLRTASRTIAEYAP
jgi:glycosyltransferase involved in cell wall biosynthesis